MKRREFLRDASGLAASTLIASQAAGDDPLTATLSEHRITSVVTRSVNTSWPRPVGRNAVRIDSASKGILCAAT